MDSGTATLESLLYIEGQMMDTPALRWMILTWDLAMIDVANNDYRRFLVVDSAALSLTGRRTRFTFSPIASTAGAVGALRQAGDAPLSEALSMTTYRIGGGYSMVCSPLAVDCTFFIGAARRPSDLLREIKSGSAMGVRVLDHVNAARNAARATHLAVGVRSAFPGRSGGDLWSGA